MLCTSVITHFHHSLCQPSTISASLSPLCVASHATGCWIIDGMLSLRDFSCRRLVCWSGCVLSSLTTVTLHWRACVCTPPTRARICVWLIKSPDALFKELFKSARVLVSKPRLDFQGIWAACGENNTRSPCTHCHVQRFVVFFFRYKSCRVCFWLWGRGWQKDNGMKETLVDHSTSSTRWKSSELKHCISPSSRVEQLLYSRNPPYSTTIFRKAILIMK